MKTPRVVTSVDDFKDGQKVAFICDRECSNHEGKPGEVLIVGQDLFEPEYIEREDIAAGEWFILADPPPEPEPDPIVLGAESVAAYEKLRANFQGFWKGPFVGVLDELIRELIEAVEKDRSEREA